MPIPADALRALSEGPSPSVAEVVLRRGVRFLLDKDGWAGRLPSAGEAPSARPPSPEEFRELVHDFLYHTIWAARKLRRGELWTAKACLDCYMKWRLLPAD